MNTRNLLLITGLSGALAVALGALGAHGLEKKVAEGILNVKNLGDYETAVQYHMFHTLALLGIVVFQQIKPAVRLKSAAYCFLAGIIFFSGSIYILSTRDLTGLNFSFLGPVTPLGGMFFIAGWLILGITLFIKKSSS